MTATRSSTTGRLPGGVAERVLDQLPVAVVVTDDTGALMYENRASLALLEPDVGHQPTGASAPWHEGSPEADLVQGALSGSVLAGDVPVVGANGDAPVTTRITVAPVVVDDRATHAVAVAWDVDARSAEEGDRALLAAIVDSTDDAVLSVDPAGLITSWNRGAESLYGYTAAEALGAPVAMLYPPAADSLRMLEQVLIGESVPYAEVERVRKGGSPVMVGEVSSPVTDPDGRVTGMATISRDITARLATQAALARTRRELEIRNRRLERSNADLEQFAYVASHDLSEPLRAVAGMVSLLGRRYRGKLDSDADEFIDFAVAGCERLRTMIEDLLAFSRTGRVELRIEEVDLGQLAARVVASLAGPIEDAGATVVIDDLPRVHADGALFSQVFQNLISNAVKFRRPDQPSVVRLSAVRDGDRWRIEVADNGIGIDEAYRDRIFRMFQRLHPVENYPGTGIGLSISERIVDRHGGKLDITGNPDGGATFRFTIPDVLQEAS
jgi:PAS domain S-box-containing protein